MDIEALEKLPFRRAFSLKLEVCSRVPRTGMDEVIQAGTIRIFKGSFVLYVGEPPEKIITCGSHPLESSFHTVLGRGYVSTEFYEYKSHIGSHIYGFIAVVAHTYVLQQGSPGRTAYN
uniref:Uncharacterized protein n=1 Tax=Tanacetum cinerariifolium TaxID=118510 RepID=A0A699GWB1_TANCI|nr:hypothetical protein [Tanacetum cinerariifolium]